ncbi:Rab11 family-interacting protein 1 [Chionoecetes opilio]|uniref:Rab11 family-interacting protein 1 n=1 Tax=Chionoecetes opilio TaxID=41210 RepID=A0A8J4YE46_CHIOP|nr:Rab11 family-interacting protein 1 [Chionoecetes opilio]
MWQPTHVQVTDTNDAFVVIALGKDKFQTSIKEKASGSVEWHEECELAIPTHGNTAALSLTAYHRNALGLDEFLGQVQLPLSEFDVYERPRNRWLKLRGKPEKDRKKGEKERGELEARVAFTVKSGSLLDVSAPEKKKNKSITSLKNLGGSLMSLGHKEKANMKSFAKSVSHKIDKIAHKPGKNKKNRRSQDSQGFPQELMQSKQRVGDADPGVISDSDEDDFGVDIARHVCANGSARSPSTGQAKEDMRQCVEEDLAALGIAEFSEEVRVNTRSSSPYSTVSRGSSLQQEDEGINLKDSTSQQLESRAPPKPARLGGNLKEVPTIAVESPVPTPSPQPSPEPPARQQPPLPDSQPPTAPLTFPNLTPITLPGQNAPTWGSSSPDSALTRSLSMSSNSGSGAKDSLASHEESSPEPIPAKRRVLPEPPVKASPPTPLNSFTTRKGNETPTEPVPSSPKIYPTKTSSTKGSQDSLAPTKPSRTARSTSLTESPAITAMLLQAPVAPSKSRSLSTSSTPKGHEQGMFSPTTKEPKGKGFALAALAAASSKLSIIDSEAAQSAPSSRHSSGQTNGSVEVFLPPTPPTPSASVFSFSSDSGTPSASNTPKENSSNPSPALTSSSSSRRGTPGLAERPGAAVVRSGSLHEKPTSPPVLDEWERKLYGRNAIGSMENMTHSDSRSSLNTSQSSSTQDLHRIDEHRSRFPETKVLTLERKQKDDGEEGSESEKQKKRKGKGGGLKAKLFGSSKERIGEEDGRVVEGGNDRMPHAPTRQSRLPQEIHDKFAGKSREDLMETIVHLQANLEKNVRHTRDLEDYIDDLLLRVMETTPQILQAAAIKSKNKVSGSI